MALTKVKSSMLDTGIADNSTDTAMTIHSSGDITLASTGSIVVPVGTTAQRPANTAGSLRYNSTTGGFEGYSTEWGSIGGTSDEYISATPTISSSEANKITVTNHSDYTNVTYKVYQGSTLFPYLQEGGDITLQPTTAGSVSVTVVATEVGVGKLFSSNSSALTVTLELKSARYWRLTGWVVQGSIGLRVGHFNMYTGTDGIGGTVTSTSQYSANREGGSTTAANASSTALNSNWYDDTPYLGATDWIMIDATSTVDINSIKIGFAGNATYFGASKMILERSDDNSTWTEVAIFGTGGVTGSSAVLVSARSAIQTINRTAEWN